MIFISATGDSRFSADLAIAQSAAALFCMGFSFDARTFANKNTLGGEIISLWKTRILLFLPIMLVSMAIVFLIPHESNLFSFAVIFRMLGNWLWELKLLSLERRNEKNVFVYIFLSEMLFFIFCLVASLYSLTFLSFMIIFWTFFTIFLSISEIKKSIHQKFELKDSLLSLRISSPFALAISNFSFRLFILALVGRELSGILFSAFSFGSIFGTAYNSAIGPSLVRSGYLLRKYGYIIVVLILSITAAVVYYYLNAQDYRIDNLTSVFMHALFLSVMGGIIMLISQHARQIQLHHHEGSNDGLILDIRYSLAIVAVVPLNYLFFGAKGLVFAFFINALVSYILYSLPKIEVVKSKVFTCGILFFLFLPVYFSVEKGIFNYNEISFGELGRKAFDFTSIYQGTDNILSYPLPIAVMVIVIVMLLMSERHNRNKDNYSYMFLTGAMGFGIMSIAMNAFESVKPEKIVLFVQFLFPMTGMILANQLAKEQYIYKHLAYVALIIVSLTTIPQLISTLSMVKYLGGLQLSPSVQIFSIYQHTQYVVVIQSCLFFYSIGYLWSGNNNNLDKYLMFMSPIMSMIVGISQSFAAISIHVIGLLLILAWRCKHGKKIATYSGVVIISIIMAIISIYLQRNSYLVFNMNSYFLIFYMFLCLIGWYTLYAFIIARMKPINILSWDMKKSIKNIVLLICAVALVSVATFNMNSINIDFEGINIFKNRLEIWSSFINQLSLDPSSWLYGVESTLSQSEYRSAHNYHLDYIYNFGIIGFMPFLILLLTTLYLAVKNYRIIMENNYLFLLCAVFIFIVVFDNFFKVGLRQLYPGLIGYFFWGLFLTNLMHINHNKHTA